MRWSWLISLLAALELSSAARATEVVFESGQTKVHLLELFTSEGCSSCPPADAWLTKLKEHPALWRDFVPIAFHVDYWDHLGWRDRFASKEWTSRQQTYAARWKAESVYTPGLAIDGREAHMRDVPEKSQELVGTLRLKVSENNALIFFKPAKSETRALEVYLARLGFSLGSDVAAGENRGRKLAHDFVVLSLQTAPLPAETSEVKLAIDKSRPEKTGALAAWIAYGGDITPIQAVGGQLPGASL